MRRAGSQRAAHGARARRRRLADPGGGQGQVSVEMLLDGGLKQLVHPPMDLVVGLVDPGLIEVVADLAEDVVVAFLLEVRHHTVLA